MIPKQFRFICSEFFCGFQILFTAFTTNSSCLSFFFSYQKCLLTAASSCYATFSLSGLLFLLFLLSIVIAILIGRYVSRHKGDYLTQEEQGCDLAEDPDTAVMHSKTGHAIQKKREWFM